MTIKLISKYRTQLMAVAMIWIGLYHLYYGFSFKPINFIFHSLGYVGVDCFMFLSGVGIYFSLSGDDNYLNFIKKRLRRILPYCLPLYLLSFVMGKDTLKHTIIDCLGLSILFRSDLTNWFTSIIIILYFITPLYYKLLKKRPLLVTMLFCIMVTIFCIFNNKFEIVYIYFRIVIYFIGLYFGYLIKNNISVNKFWIIFIILLSVFGFSLIYFLTHYYRNDIMYIYPAVIIVPGLLLFTAWIIDKTHFVKRILDFIGNYTYQYYLLHKPILDFMTVYCYSMFYMDNINYDFIFNHSTLYIALIVSIIYKKLVDYVINVIINKET